MPTVLPPARTELSNTPSQSNAVAKAGLGKMWDYVTNLLGTAGTDVAARTALLAAKSGANTDITALTGLTGAISGATDVTTTGNTILGNASTDTLNVGNGGIIKDASGNTGIGTTPRVKFDVGGEAAAAAQLRVVPTAGSVAGIGAILRNDGTDTYFMLTASGDAYGTFNALRPLRFNNTTGKAILDGTATSLSTATGTAPSYSARAIVNFNGTGTVAINASGNVSSITDNGTGDYTVNLTTALPDAFGVISALGSVAVSGVPTGQVGVSGYMVNASSARILFYNSSSATPTDMTMASVTILR